MSDNLFLRPASESDAKLPRNLKTHFEATLAAMVEMEGTSWAAMMAGEVGDHEGGIRYSKKILDSGSDESTVVSGSQNRYIVEPEGTVRFSRAHATKRATEKARGLGFDLI